MSDQELHTLLEETAIAVTQESRATRACVVVMALLTMLVCWLFA